MISDPVEQWISERVRGKTFADVGGLWGTTGERVTTAHKYGASSLTMIDHSRIPAEWESFWQRMRDHNIDSVVLSLPADVEDWDFRKNVCQYDLVHCNGLLYHTPDPLGFLASLRTITKDYLIVGTVVLDDSRQISLGMWNSSSIFVPSLSDIERRRVREVYSFPAGHKAQGIDEVETCWMQQEDRHDARPFWWLHTPTTVRKLIDLVGFTIESESPGWDGRQMMYLCRTR